MYRLVFQNRDTARAPFVGRESITVIGRETGCTLPLVEAGISDRHAAIERRADGLYIRDLGSANGVRVNGERIAEQRLAGGDEIELGAVRFKFEVVHDPPVGQRALDPWQWLAGGVITVLVTGQVALFGWIFSQQHPRGARTDVLKGQRQQQQQAKAAASDAPQALAPLPATATPAPPPSTVLNRMIKISRVEQADSTLRIQVKAQVGERALDARAAGVSVECAGKITWLPVPGDWENFTTRTLSARACAGAIVRTYYRKALQDEWVNR